MTNINQKQIAKNTSLLYIRMGLMMLVGLYTSRVVLEALGQTDFGIYNVVGGVVAMFSFLSGTMSAACQKFFAQEISKGNYKELNKTFNLCLLVFIVIIILIVLLSETAGLLLLNHKLKTQGRLDAAKIVFQCSIVSFALSIIRSPYQGMIIIKEKMKVFAYISIVEVLANLGVALFIRTSHNDRLILYGYLMIAVNLVVSLCYILYCYIFYHECRITLYWNKIQLKEIFSFAGWNMLGALAGICKSQGLNILLNIFFLPAVNAARGMAYKVLSSVQLFGDNFITAFKPQLLKSYSDNDNSGFFKLINQSTKFSFYLLFIISLPLILETPLILDIWLKQVPEHTISFTRLVLILALTDILSYPLGTAMQAYGKIKRYQIEVSGILLSILPISYLFLKLHFPPESVYVISIILSAFSIFYRVHFISNCIGLDKRVYFQTAIKPILIVISVSSVIPVFLEFTMNPGYGKFFIVCGSAVLITAVTVFTLGMTKTERKHSIDYITQLLNIKNKRTTI